ncbi:MAG TPA: TolC family protein, partial [Stellaceae bacterium]|nr:TolC family protein [Stellaceae bacterium]
MTTIRRAAALAAMVGLSGCLVGPDYLRPDAPAPATYKEAWKPGPREKGWAPGRPNDAIDRGAWWSIYPDPVLDKLERQIDISNQNLKAAEASFRESEALVTEARAGLFPTLDAAASAVRSRSSGSTFGTGNISNTFRTTLNASWVLDLWGSVRRQIEASTASAQASAATLANARLAAQASLATAYMQLRVADELQRLLSASVKAFTQALQIVTNQYKSGTADQSAVDQARAQLEGTKAQLIA